ncbi:MAG: cob(I)yrinic acid a,c-diamide adenosyltransferase [Clostridiales Family XIII bacterium]|jgi:cob(I)alamin adenosyltransferase|nr:cob(I)yrinic acid a,c-diamide adenosyltransferase [Clostridiales Family XIII bacterium]
MLAKGYMQVYTGDGKGKTTAALGLALRALCAGGRVYFGQFMKGQNYSELKAVEHFARLTLVQFGDPHFVCGKPSPEDIAHARSGLSQIDEALAAGGYDVVILDEANTAMSCGLLSPREVLDVVARRPARTEVVLTGRGAPCEIIEAADLVTEMREIKHYYRAGVEARVGIEQ